MDSRIRLIPALLFAATLGGCDLIGDIFEAGFWVGIIAVIILVVVIWAVVQLFD